jgi:transglutaminase-like putative cysteine protease
MIRAETFDAATAASLPIGDPNLAPYLESAPFLELDEPEIRKKAAELRGTETNSYKVAQNIRKWIHANMKPDYTIGVPRGCADVLKKPRGVCRDYATLFAGLARAAGIPTRVAGGIMYAQGKFFYHAWVECWVGKWVPFDATLDQDFVDATHVKFSQGDVNQMYNIATIVGRIKLNDLLAN